jgi:hypothetical protein
MEAANPITAYANPGLETFGRYTRKKGKEGCQGKPCLAKRGADSQATEGCTGPLSYFVYLPNISRPGLVLIQRLYAQYPRNAAYVFYYPF